MIYVIYSQTEQYSEIINTFDLIILAKQQGSNKFVRFNTLSSLKIYSLFKLKAKEKFIKQHILLNV